MLGKTSVTSSDSWDYIFQYVASFFTAQNISVCKRIRC